MAVFVFTAFAAEDPNGNWTATMDTPMGAMAMSFQIKMDGAKVTGTVGNDMMGQVKISDGKLEEDNKISFTIASNFGEISYAGTIKGDEMNLTMSVGGGQFTLPLTVKRVKG